MENRQLLNLSCLFWFLQGGVHNYIRLIFA